MCRPTNRVPPTTRTRTSTSRRSTSSRHPMAPASLRPSSPERRAVRLGRPPIGTVGSRGIGGDTLRRPRPPLNPVPLLEEVHVARRRTRRVVLVVLVVFAVIAAAAIPIGLKIRADAATDAARAAAVGLAQGWRAGTLASVPFHGTTGADAAKRVAAATAGLTSAEADRPVSVDVVSVTKPAGVRASARLRVT